MFKLLIEHLISKSLRSVMIVDQEKLKTIIEDIINNENDISRLNEVLFQSSIFSKFPLKIFDLINKIRNEH